MKTYICNFIPHQSPNLVDQQESIDWLIQYHGNEYSDLFCKYAVNPEYIVQRLFYAPGIAGIPADPAALYALEETQNPNMLLRSELAQHLTEKIFQDVYSPDEAAPNHINHVSCTHYHSPSAPQRLVVKNAWNETTQVSHLYHMGCYAAFPALRVSNAYVEEGAARTDVVHTELCSFHLDKSKVTPDQIIMKTLFADGAIRYSVVNEAHMNQYAKKGYEILSRHEIIVPGTEKEMSWKIGPTGFAMTLTRNVPVYLARIIEQFMRTLFNRSGLDYDRDKERTLFAIHPGGPKIVESIKRVLDLSPRQVEHALDILTARGNMSSATVPFIWNHILNDDRVDQEYVASVAFGPGLTITGAMLKLCR